ncbi:MAG: hypothetical protein ACXAE3_12150 [Candidatus Kariarchaeaceae archaeon]|jgi:hypothetical protein
MSFNDLAAEATASGDIGVGFLLDGQGNIYWEYGRENWAALDPSHVLQEWQNTVMAPIVVDNLKFTVIGKTPARLVSTNVGGQGHLIGAACTNWPGGFVVAWCPASITPDVAYSVCQKLADTVTS